MKTYIEYWNPHPHHGQKHTGGKECIRRFLKRCPLHQGSGTPLDLSGLEQNVRGHEGSRHHQATDPHSPWITHAGDGILQHGDVEQTTNRVANRANRQGQAASLLKIRSHQTHHRDEGQSAADSNEQSVTDEELPVTCRKRSSKNANELEEGARQQCLMKVARIREAPGDGREEKQEECLKGSYPGDIGRRPLQRGDVV